MINSMTPLPRDQRKMDVDHLNLNYLITKLN